MHVVLVEPQIAPNTGNIIRLCANTGSSLDLIEPLGFSLDDRLLKRAGLDYHELATVRTHAALADVKPLLPGRWFAFSSRGTRRYDSVTFRPDDVLVFGSEQLGLSDQSLGLIHDENILSIPMVSGNRSLNLANAAAVVVYEAWRQLGFEKAGATPGTGLTSETPGADPFDR